MVYICVHAVKVLPHVAMNSCKLLYTSSRTSQIFKFSSLEHNRGISKRLCESMQVFNLKFVRIALLIWILDFCVMRNMINK
jgi:hypothetical protein